MCADGLRRPRSARVEKPKVKTIGHQHRDREGAGEVAARTPGPSCAARRRCVTPGRLSISASGAQHEHAGQQVEAEQVEHAEAHREQDGADDRLAGLHA